MATDSLAPESPTDSNAAPARPEMPTWNDVGPHLQAQFPRLSPERIDDLRSKWNDIRHQHMEKRAKEIADELGYTGEVSKQAGIFGTSWIPIYSGMRRGVLTAQAADARQNITSGRGTQNDYLFAEGFKRYQEREEAKPWYEKAASTAVEFLPEMLGAGWAAKGLRPVVETAGKGIVGRAMANVAANLATKQGLKHTAALTALMPTAWVDRWAQNNLKEGRQGWDLRGAPPAVGLALTQAGILGSVGAQLPEGQGWSAIAIALPGQVAAGMAESAVANAGLSFAAATELPYVRELDTGYGLLGDIYNRGIKKGEWGPTIQHGLSDIAAFTLYSAVHARPGGRKAPPREAPGAPVPGAEFGPEIMRERWAETVPPKPSDASLRMELGDVRASQYAAEKLYNQPGAMTKDEMELFHHQSKEVANDLYILAKQGVPLEQAVTKVRDKIADGLPGNLKPNGDGASTAEELRAEADEAMRDAEAVKRALVRRGLSPKAAATRLRGKMKEIDALRQKAAELDAAKGPPEDPPQELGPPETPPEPPGPPKGPPNAPVPSDTALTIEQQAQMIPESDRASWIKWAYERQGSTPLSEERPVAPPEAATESQTSPEAAQLAQNATGAKPEAILLLIARHISDESSAPSDGLTRLYQHRHAEESDSTTAGSWWTSSKRVAEEYQHEAGDTGELLFVDVPTKDLEQYRAKNTKYKSWARDPWNDFVIPNVERAKTLATPPPSSGAPEVHMTKPEAKDQPWDVPDRQPTSEESAEADRTLAERRAEFDKRMDEKTRAAGMKRLSDKNKRVLFARTEGKTLQEIAAEEGDSWQNIDQMIKRIAKKAPNKDFLAELTDWRTGAPIVASEETKGIGLAEGISLGAATDAAIEKAVKGVKNRQEVAESHLDAIRETIQQDIDDLQAELDRASTPKQRKQIRKDIASAKRRFADSEQAIRKMYGLSEPGEEAQTAPGTATETGGPVEGAAQEPASLERGPDFGQPQAPAGSPGGGSGESRPRPAPTAAMNAEQAKVLARNRLDALAKSGEQTNQQTLALATERLAANEREGEQLTDRFHADWRAGKAIKADVVDQTLVHLHGIELQNELDKTADAINARVRQGDNVSQAEFEAADVRMTALASRIGQVAEVLQGMGTTAGRLQQMRQRAIANDFTLGPMLAKAAAAKGKPLSEAEVREITKDARDIAEADKKAVDATATPEEQRDARIAGRDLRANQSTRIRNFKAANLSKPEKIFAEAREGLNMSRSIITAFDLSAHFRHGLFASLGRPIRTLTDWIPRGMKAAMSEAEAKRQYDELMQLPEAHEFQEAGFKLHNPHAGPEERHELYVGKYIRKIPGVAASERAFTTALNKMRVDLFKSMKESMGGGTLTPEQAHALANAAAIFTGDANAGKHANTFHALANIFFSPKYLLGRLQLAVGQPLWRGDAATRGIIAKEYARSLAGLGMVYGLAKLLVPDSTVELDSRSSDFGKIKMGNTRVDPLGGLAQIATFSSRAYYGETKPTSGKPAYSLLQGKPGQQDIPKTIFNFVRSKMAPVPGTALDVMLRKHFMGQKLQLAPKDMTPQSIIAEPSVVGNLTVPLSVRDVYESMQDLGVPKGPAVSLLAILGMGVQVYNAAQKQQKQNTANPVVPQKRWLAAIGS